jgi:excisionase family DNA binding protein
MSELKEKRNMNALKSVDEAAGLLGISPWTVRAWIRDGKLRPVRLGRRVLLSESELERLVEESQKPRETGTVTNDMNLEAQQ